MDSLGVLRSEPSLALFPAIAAISGMVYIAMILGGAYVVTGAEPGPVTYGALFVVYLGTSFVAAFFSAALVHNAREIFDGRDPTLREGLDAAWGHRRQLFVWALISAVVGVILRSIESSDNMVARLVAGLFSVAWGILTYFIIPVIVFEDVSVRGMFERSGQTFKQTWGETAGAGFGVGLVTVLFAIVGLAVAGVVFLVLGPTTAGLIGAIAVGAVVILLAFLLGNTLTAIAKTALYVYATEGKRPSEFDNVDFSKATR